MRSDPTYNYALLDTFLHLTLMIGAGSAVCGLIAVVVCVFWKTH